MQQSCRSRIFSYLRITGVGATIGFVGHSVFSVFAELLAFYGASMEPTIYENDLGIGEKVTSYDNLKRGDIVVVSAADNPSLRICKRIVALEGDKVSYTPGGSDVDEYQLHPRLNHFIPKGHMWLEGDNSKLSYDSRYYGPIPIGLVRSRVAAKFAEHLSAYQPKKIYLHRHENEINSVNKSA